MPEDGSRKMIEKIRDDYNRIAKEWDLSRHRPSQMKIDLVREAESDMAVLDAGCGNGMMLPYILQRGAFYFGLDISDKLIEIARERYAQEIEEGKANFVVGEATELPFKDDEFDFVISFAVLHHLPSPETRKEFFSEIYRVTRPGGKVKITVWNLLNDWARERFEVGEQLGYRPSGDLQVPWRGTKGEIINRFVHQFSAEELAGFADEAGFSEVYVNNFNRAGARVENGEELVLEMEK